MSSLLRTTSKVILLAGLLTGFNSHALIYSLFQGGDPGAANQTRNVGLAFLGAGIVSFVFPPAVVIGGPLVGLGALLDGNDANTQLAVVDTQSNLKQLVTAGVYSANEATQIADEVNGMSRDRDQKLASLGCQISAKSCHATRTEFQRVFNLSPITVSYLNANSGIQN